MTMLEQMARKLCDRDPDALVPLGYFNAINRDGGKEWVDRPPVPAWKLFEAKARAALEAIRTPDMNAVLRASKSLGIPAAEIDLVWCFLIDAALAEVASART